jgi:hypothetical protein
MFFHDGFELRKSSFPHGAEGFDKVGDHFHLIGIEVVIHLAANLFLREELAFGEDLEVLRDGGACGIEVGSAMAWKTSRRRFIM